MMSCGQYACNRKVETWNINKIAELEKTHAQTFFIVEVKSNRSRLWKKLEKLPMVIALN